MQELDVFLLRMEGAAAAEVGLGDQGTNAAAVGVPIAAQFGFVRLQVDGLLAAGEVETLFAGKAEELDAAVALFVGFAAGDRAGEALFAVKAVAGAEDDGFAFIRNATEGVGTSSTAATSFDREMFVEMGFDYYGIGR